jgi:hypothetical protein
LYLSISDRKKKEKKSQKKSISSLHVAKKKKNPNNQKKKKKKLLWSPLIKLPGSIPAGLHFLFGRGTNLNLDLKISKTNAINLHPINIPCDWGHWIKSTGKNFFVKLF